MSIFPLTKLKTIFLSEFILVFAMAMGVVPQEFSYLVLLLLVVSFIKLNKLDALKLFIISIPFFVALPSNQFSDSMSIWRFLIFALVVKSSPFQKGGLRGILKFIKNPPSPLFQRGSSHCKLFSLTILFFIIAFLSLILAQDVGVGIKKILFLSNILLLFPVVIWTIKTESDFRQIIKFIFYSTGLLVAIGYFQFILTFFIPLFTFWQFWAQNIIVAFYGQNLGDLLSYSNTWFSYYNILPPTLRMFSVMPDSHSFAMLIVISIPALLSLIYLNYSKTGVHSLECSNFSLNKINSYRLKPELQIFALIIFFLAIFFSGSRGIWVGSIFALLAGVYLFVGSQKSYFSKLLIYSLLLFFILMPVSSIILRGNQEVQLIRSNTQLSNEDREKLSVFERAISISDFSEVSNKGRLQIWSETLMSVKDNLFLGVGFGNFPLILDEKITNSKKGASAHNIYLDILSEVGIIALIIFLLILREILKTAYSLFFKLKTGYLKIFAGSFFIYFTWICAYGFFDVVIFNDKVLIMIVAMTGVLYSSALHNPKKM